MQSLLRCFLPQQQNTPQAFACGVFVIFAVRQRGAAGIVSGGLLLAGAPFFGSELEGFLETHHVGGRTERFEGGGFLAEVLFAVVGGFDGEADAALHLDDA